MTKIKKKEPPGTLSVYIHKNRCNGCVVCLRACPTRAIRVRKGYAEVLPELCVDCGECIRVCPRDAVAPRVATYRDVAKFKVTAVLPSTVIYTQFGEDVFPNDILLALTKLGFDYVFDMAVYCEWVNLAAMDWLARHSEIKTAISPICPGVLRLVAKRFSNLIPNIMMLDPPREVGAKHIRRMLRKKLNLADEEIGVFHVSPCAAKVVAINQPLALKRSFLSGALGLHELYGDILLAIKELTYEEHENVLFKASGSGLSWGATGGELSGLGRNHRALSVSGLTETLEVLEQIESGQLHDVRYVECRLCQDGCLGGPLCVENRYLAKATLKKLIHVFGDQPRTRPKEIATLLAEGFFEPDKQIKPLLFPLDKNPIRAMQKLKMVDELTAKLPGKLCGACGAPDCRSLAEDVVLNKARMTDCPFYEDEGIFEEGS